MNNKFGLSTAILMGLLTACNGDSTPAEAPENADAAAAAARENADAAAGVARVEADAAVCTPDCTDRVCGTDGCGGECGTCPGEQI